jgi:hypothetical protein
MHGCEAVGRSRALILFLLELSLACGACRGTALSAARGGQGEALVALLVERRADDEFVLQAVLTLATLLQHEPLRSLLAATQVSRPTLQEDMGLKSAQDGCERGQPVCLACTQRRPRSSHRELFCRDRAAVLPCARGNTACCQAPRYLVDLLEDEHAGIAAAAEAALDVAASAGQPWAAQVRARCDAVRERWGSSRGAGWLGLPGLWAC